MCSKPLVKDTGWRLFVRTIVARAYPRVIGGIREKTLILFDVLLPMVPLVAYGFMYEAMGAPGSFIGFVVLGGAMMAFWLNMLWAMALQFYWEKETGNLALYLIAPASLKAILLGMAFGGMIYSSIRAIAIVGAATWLFGIDYEVTDPAMLAIVFVVTLAALYGLGMACASLFLFFGRGAFHVIGLAQEPVYLVSGVYSPLRTLHFWVAAGASVLPITLAIDAMRQLLFAGSRGLGFLDVRIELALLVIQCVVFLAAAAVLLAYMERRAVAEGKLTQSRA
ncbi:MAG: ABC transporter permease [Vicinamibacterales bacterium]